jgi:hypothetical protein
VRIADSLAAIDSECAQARRQEPTQLPPDLAVRIADSLAAIEARLARSDTGVQPAPLPAPAAAAPGAAPSCPGSNVCAAPELCPPPPAVDPGPAAHADSAALDTLAPARQATSLPKPAPYTGTGTTCSSTAYSGLDRHRLLPARYSGPPQGGMSHQASLSLLPPFARFSLLHGTSFTYLAW